ncbi:HigA family addiction module antitoxin [[Phormidium] sp. ETS-05]|uniref:HigA family addiction module antitoxin n=1 Tax=[Phormidium] sp. ETS-05 TaxID=222819 RepID=UPI0018EF0298|nr:HigA family addiction module antitoxin [[Phormidium] sp. ETS-05]
MQNLENIVNNRLKRPAHPGEVLADILDDLQITEAEFAKALNVSAETVNEIIDGKKAITIDLAIRLGKALGNGPQIWLNLQQKIDIWDAMTVDREQYEKVHAIV